MTLHATRDGQKITIHGNCGINLTIDGAKYVSVGITEDAQHLRYFWHQLGSHLEEAEKEREQPAVDAT